MEIVSGLRLYPVQYVLVSLANTAFNGYAAATIDQRQT